MLGRLGIATCALLAAMSFSAGAAAQSSDPAAAQAAFDEAKRLVAANDYAHACPKFAESFRLDPGPGTEFNLANCFEHEGKLASAWSHFVSAADTLSLQHDKVRSDAARTRAKALEPRLIRLTINVPDTARVDGLKVRRDKEEVGSALFGSALPLDPGEYTVSAEAPGHKRWEQRVTLSKEGATVTVDVPALPTEGTAPTTPPVTPLGTTTSPEAQSPPPPPPDTTSSSFGGQKVAALVAGGVGVAGLVVGVIFWRAGTSAWSDSQSECASPTNCPNHAQAVSDHDSASSDATISTITVVGGSLLVATGVVLWLTAPGGQGATTTTGMRLAPSVHTRGGGLSLQGGF